MALCISPAHPLERPSAEPVPDDRGGTAGGARVAAGGASGPNSGLRGGPSSVGRARRPGAFLADGRQLHAVHAPFGPEAEIRRAIGCLAAPGSDRRLWERHRTDPDRLVLRVGTVGLPAETAATATGDGAVDGAVQCAVGGAVEGAE